MRTGFQHYLASLGDKRAAEVLGVKRRTVKAWRLGVRTPRPLWAQHIVERAPVTFADIYGSARQTR